MKGLIAAIEFITIIPLSREKTYAPRSMIAYFPVVGLIIGCGLSVFDHLAHLVWDTSIVAFLDVVFLIIITGALHLDGVGDAADGLFSHRSREKALAIMKDSRIGNMGVVAVVCILFIKWAALSVALADRSLLLILVPAYARSAMLPAIRWLPYGRSEGGTAWDLFSKPLGFMDFRFILILIGLSFFLGWRALILNTGFVLITAILMRIYQKRLGCITGDLLGALTETTEAILFLLLAAGASL